MKSMCQDSELPRTDYTEGWFVVGTDWKMQFIQSARGLSWVQVQIDLFVCKYWELETIVVTRNLYGFLGYGTLF